MKHILILFSALLFIGCNEIDPVRQASRAREKAETSEIIIKDLLLGFRFDMSPEEVDAHFKKLLEEGKVYLKHESAYGYDYETSLGTMKGYFTYKFYNNQLYEISLNLSSNNILLLDREQLVLSSVKRVFDKKNDIDNFQKYSFKFSSDDDSAIYYYINQNLCISLSGILSLVSIEYINCPIDALVQDSIQKAKDAELDKTSLDL